MSVQQDAVKTTGYESKLQVKDLIELVHEAMQKFTAKGKVTFAPLGDFANVTLCIFYIIIFSHD